MGNYFVLFLIICSGLFCAQNIIHPEYISAENTKGNLEQTTDLQLFYYKQIQYIGTVREKININYVDSERFSEILKDNYKKTNVDALHKEFKERHYDNIKIFVDSRQSTPLIKTETDLSKITEAELISEVDRINEGKKPTREIPQKQIFYDGFPITIYNLETKERIIGFGNNVALELEALNKNKEWQKINHFRKYNCGNGINYIVLKPNEIATVLEARITGNFKTKLRYRLGNVISNEFEGSINDHYLTELK